MTAREREREAFARAMLAFERGTLREGTSDEAVVADWKEIFYAPQRSYARAGWQAGRRFERAEQRRKRAMEGK